MLFDSLLKRKRKRSSHAGTELSDENNLTAEHDEILKSGLGLGILRSLASLDSDATQDEIVKQYNQGNMDLWRHREGITGRQAEKEGTGMAGHQVRVDSADYNYHYHGAALSKLLPWFVAGMIGVGGTFLYDRLSKPQGPTPPPANGSMDTDTRSTLRPYTGPEPTDSLH